MTSDESKRMGAMPWATLVALATLLLTMMGMVYKFDHDLETNLAIMNDRMGKLETETAVIKTKIEHMQWPSYPQGGR